MQTKPPKKPKAMRYFSFNFIYVQRAGFKVAQVWYRRLLPPSAHIRHTLKCINKPAFCWVSPLLATSLHFVTGGHNPLEVTAWSWQGSLTYSLAPRLCCLVPKSSSSLLLASPLLERAELWDSPCRTKGKKDKNTTCASFQEKKGDIRCQVPFNHGP